MQRELPTIKLETFEGPFDLLLELAHKKRVDLTEISLKAVTDDFLKYISEHSIPDLIQADFLIVAATLTLLKIRSLLPSLTPEEEEEINSLTDRVRMYQLYREQGLALQKQWGSKRLFSAGFWFEGEKPSSLPTSLPNIAPEELSNAFFRVLAVLPKPVHPKGHLVRRGRSLSDWLDVLQKRLERVKNIVFQKTVKGIPAEDTAVSFMAVLELARKQTVTITQTDPFSDITVTRI